MYNYSYNSSHAIVIGIDTYNSHPEYGPLLHARNDASMMADCLKSKYGFPEENILQIYDKEATAQNIRHSLASKYGDETDPDDRFIFFFAGHGDTRLGNQKETGYLIPVDGDPDDLSTLLRWDMIIRNSDLVRAKHMAFFLDACFGGLAFNRGSSSGRMRFTSDMLTRYSRQVLTAGKADELVSDAGGPRQGHSIFTGHLLDALDGKAALAEGLLSANQVMSYVQRMVGTHHESNQTPHYGNLEGDGDLIFEFPESTDADDENSPQIIVTPFEGPPSSEYTEEEYIENLKTMLPKEEFRIKFDDMVTTEVRRYLASSELAQFSMFDDQIDAESFSERINVYEKEAKRLLILAALTGRWGEAENSVQLRRLLCRVAEAITSGSGKTVWLNLRWLPVTMMSYLGGMMALGSGNHHVLAHLFEASVPDATRRSHRSSVFHLENEAMLGLLRTNIFKHLPKHSREYVPKSEFLFLKLQATIEDLFFLGGEYETFFDAYECLQALHYADVSKQGGRDDPWFPPGRFAWKHNAMHESPLTRLTEEVARRREHHPIIRAGLFGGDVGRFEKISELVITRVKSSGWG